MDWVQSGVPWDARQGSQVSFLEAPELQAESVLARRCQQRYSAQPEVLHILRRSTSLHKQHMSDSLGFGFKVFFWFAVCGCLLSLRLLEDGRIDATARTQEGDPWLAYPNFSVPLCQEINRAGALFTFTFQSR